MSKQAEQRLPFFYIISVAIVLILAARLWGLQIRHGDHYSRLAEGNRMRRVRVMPTRGIIMDRNGKELIRSRPAFTVSLVPGGIPKDSQEVFDYLKNILGLTEDELKEAIEKGKRTLYEPVKIVRDVPPSIVVTIEENRLYLPGVFIEEEWVRDYCYDGSASHLVGYLGMISSQELQRYGPSYSSSDLVGKVGLEGLYETELRGIPGSQTIEVNALSRAVQVINYVEPIPGYNIVMTIDEKLQTAAKNAFLAHTQTLGEAEDKKQYNGVVVAMNPKTGEILVMVSLPDYDAASLLDSSARNSYYAGLVQDKSLPLFNRAVQGQYGPGSVFKPFIAVAMLEEGVVGANQIFNATGTSQYGVRDWVIAQGSAPFGEIDMVDALAMSSNHYFAKFGTDVGIDLLSGWLREFGFGSPTGVIGIPEESSGIVPDREWKKQYFSGRPQSEQIWYPSDTEQISIGQGFITVTPVQLAVAYSAIANGGTIYRPSIVKQVLDPEGNVIEEIGSTPIRQMNVAASTWDAVTKGMQAVITHPRGTARNAFRDFPLSVAGKTGSYEIPNQDAHGVFAAFAPVEDPEIVVVVVVEHGIGGGSSAAPIGRMVLDAYFGFDLQELPD